MGRGRKGITKRDDSSMVVLVFFFYRSLSMFLLTFLPPHLGCPFCFLLEGSSMFYFPHCSCKDRRRLHKTDGKGSGRVRPGGDCGSGGAAGRGEGKRKKEERLRAVLGLTSGSLFFFFLRRPRLVCLCAWARFGRKSFCLICFG